MALHPGHRAVLPDGFACDEITADPVEWSTGQPAVAADAVLWAIGRVRPNTGWLPDEMLDEHGFVRVTPELTVPGQPGVFAVGDVAATDPLRSSARNRADGLLAHNVRAGFEGRPLRSYRPPEAALGFGAGRAVRRPRSVRAERSCVPLPRLVDRSRAAAVDRAVGHLPRSARLMGRSVRNHTDSMRVAVCVSPH